MKKNNFCSKYDSSVKSAPRPREIPSILQGEVAGLNKKFVARLDKSQSNTAGDVHIVVSISDLDLPPVKELKPGINILLNFSYDSFFLILNYF